MVRPFIKRRISSFPQVRYYKPRGVPLSALEEVVVTEDAYEALRLVDLEGMYQDEAAKKMGISRQTIGRILEQARKAVADALINGKAIRIEGGSVTVAPPSGAYCPKGRGRRRWGWR
jgi:predicted DNA-binding protein (UPF0251 family)